MGENLKKKTREKDYKYDMMTSHCQLDKYPFVIQSERTSDFKQNHQR